MVYAAVLQHYLYLVSTLIIKVQTFTYLTCDRPTLVVISSHLRVFGQTQRSLDTRA